MKTTALSRSSFLTAQSMKSRSMPGVVSFSLKSAAPEDWSGSVDMDPEDYKGTRTDENAGRVFTIPLEFLGKD